MCHVWVYFTLWIFSFKGAGKRRECRACVTFKGYVLSVSFVLNFDSLEPFAVDCWVIKQGKVSLEIMFICLVIEMWKLHLKHWSNCVHIICKPTLQYHGHGGNGRILPWMFTVRFGGTFSLFMWAEQSLYTIPLIPLCMYITKILHDMPIWKGVSGWLFAYWRMTFDLAVSRDIVFRIYPYLSTANTTQHLIFRRLHGIIFVRSVGHAWCKKAISLHYVCI